MKKKALKIGIAGLGTVGAGVVKLLEANRDTITARSGRAIEVVAVSARNQHKDRGIDISSMQWLSDPIAVAEADVDVVVELIGGADGAAHTLCEKALSNGKHVVTANKALIAKHGGALASLAQKEGVVLAFEAAVAGGIPVLKSIREGLAGNAISRVVGILNGTCNYILTTMEKTGREFADVLREAQELGYAEADPEFDIEGIDTAHKLAILTALSFGTELSTKSLYTEGITKIAPADITHAAELGYAIKLVGIASKVNGMIEQRVHPVLVKADSFLARVDGAFNAVSIEGDAIGTLLLEGPGAGEMATASAVVADIIDVARGNTAAPLGVLSADMKKASFATISDIESSYYLRISVVDEVGVLEEITKVFAKRHISIESVSQKISKTNTTVNLILITHKVKESEMHQVLEKLKTLDVVMEEPHVIRVL